MRRGVVILAVGFVLGVFGHGVHATTMMAMTLPQIVQDSDVIAYTTLVRKRAKVVNARIVTECELMINEAIRAPKPMSSKITVVTMQGQMGKVGMQTIGEVDCGMPGAKQVVAARRLDNVYRVIGMSQGWFEVRLDKEGRAWVHRSSEHLLERGQGHSLEQAKKRDDVPLDGFLDELRSLARQYPRRYVTKTKSR